MTRDEIKAHIDRHGIKVVSVSQHYAVITNPVHDLNVTLANVPEVLEELYERGLFYLSAREPSSGGLYFVCERSQGDTKFNQFVRESLLS